MRPVFLLLLLVTACAPLEESGPMRLPAAEDAIPWISYEGQSEGGVIVERADGTQSRAVGREIIAQSQVDDPLVALHEIESYGWSPSGAWLAWSTGHYGPGRGYDVNTLWLTRGSDTKAIPLPLPDNQSSPGDMFVRWHPQRDTLIVYYYAADANQLLLVNATTDITHYYTNVTWPTWSPDGRWVAFMRSEAHGTWEDRQWTHHLILVGADGVPHERPIMDFYGCDASYKPFHEWAVTGELITIGSAGETLIFEDMFTGTQTRVLLPTTHVHSFDWQPNGRYALYQTRTSCDEADNGLWLLDRSTGENRRLGDVNTDLYISGSMGGVEFTKGGWSPASHWSQDGRALLYWTANGPVLYDLVQQTHLPLTILPSPSTTLEASVQWLPDGNLIVLWQNTLARVTRETGDVQIIAHDVYNISLSPNGRWLAVSGTKPCANALTCLYDTSGRFISRLPRVSSVDSYINYVSFDWHPSEPWLIISHSIPDHLPVALVTNVSGTVRREVTWYNSGGKIVRWLPPAVLTGSWGTPVAMPRQPDAEAVLEAEPIMAAWSPDETRIAATTYEATYLLDAASLRILQRIPHASIGHEAYEVYEPAHLALEWVRWDADGQHLVVSRVERKTYGEPGMQVVTRYDVSGPTVQLVETVTTSLENNPAFPRRDRYGDYGLRRFVSEGETRWQVINSAGDVLSTLPSLNTEPPSLLAMARDESWLIYGDTLMLRVWETAASAPRLTVRSWRRFEPAPVAVTADETRLVMSITDGGSDALVVYDLTQAGLPVLDHVNRHATFLAWNGAGTRFIAVTGHTLSLVAVQP